MEPATTIGQPAVAPPGNVKKLRNLSQQLEAQFLSEMFKSAGLGKSPEGFGGGVGEEQFASFLREQQALAMSKAGGIGLAEAIFNSLIGVNNVE